jgi:hypothetical protein
MPNEYIEDIFIDFYETCVGSSYSLQQQDETPAANFYSLLIVNKPLTQAQGSYILKILDKYKRQAQLIGLDYTNDILNPVWKTPFRVIDQTKRIYVEQEASGKIVVCLKHPYTYKESFEKDVLKKIGYEKSEWDGDQKVRKFSIYDLNLIVLNEFVTRHGFDIDNSFLECLSLVEEVWNSADEVLPHCIVHNKTIHLKNAPSSALEFYETHKTTNIYDNLLLAKHLGYKLNLGQKPEGIVEKIASSDSTYFWIKESARLFDLYKKTSGNVALLVNDDNNLYEWLKSFIGKAIDAGINKEEIKICFRERNDEQPKFNEWVKGEGLGGSLESGRFFIFKNKPPKWLFKDLFDVKLILVNKPFPPMSMISQTWIDNHPCVVYIGDLRPSIQKENKIVEL